MTICILKHLKNCYSQFTWNKLTSLKCFSPQFIHLILAGFILTNLIFFEGLFSQLNVCSKKKMTKKARIQEIIHIQSTIFLWKIWKWFFTYHAFLLIELGLENVGFWGEGKTGKKNPLRAREKTNKKLKPPMATPLRLEPARPHLVVDVGGMNIVTPFSLMSHLILQ